MERVRETDPLTSSPASADARFRASRDASRAAALLNEWQVENEAADAKILNNQGD